MKKSFKKFIAFVCAIAMVVSSMTVQTANADIYSEETTAWQGYFNAGGGITPNGTDGYSVSASVGTTWWNIQTWLPKVNFTKGYTYTCSFTLTSNAPKNFRVDNRVGDGLIFTETSTEGWVDNGNGTYTYNYVGVSEEITSTSQIDVRVSYGYFDGVGSETRTELEGWTANAAIDMTMANFAITREATGETEADPTTAAIVTDGDGFTPLGDSDKTLAPYGVYGEIYQGPSWAGGKIAVKGEGATFDDLAVKIIATNGVAGGWGIQVKYPLASHGLDATKTYDYTVKYNASKVGTMFLKMEGNDDGAASAAAEGENTITGTMKGTATVAVFELSGFSVDTIVDFNSIEIVEHVEGEEPTSPEGEEPTVPEETTTVTAGDVDYSNLEYTEVSCDGGETIYYSVISNNIVGLGVPGSLWYTDAGNTFQIAFAGDVNPGSSLEVKINDVVTTSGVVGMIGDGIVKVNPNQMAADAYTKVVITNTVNNTSFEMIVKKGSPEGEETTTPEEPTTPEETTTAPTTDTDYSNLEFTEVSCDGGETIYYSVISNDIVGLGVPGSLWYTDAGNTFQIAFAGDVNPGSSLEVKINDVVTTSGVVGMIGDGIVKVNPNQMAEDAYTKVVITNTVNNTSFEMIVKKGTPAAPDFELEIAGWQIAAGDISVGGKTYSGGVRTVYIIDTAIVQEAEEFGLVYGFGTQSESDMVIGSTSGYIIDAPGKTSVEGEFEGQDADETAYAMIMASNLASANANALNQTYSVRAYAKYADGTVKYSVVKTYSTYKVADAAYQAGSMTTIAGHDYLFNLLKKVDPNYVAIPKSADDAVAGA